MDEWRKIECYICTVKYHSAIKMNEILPSVATRVGLMGIMLNEISQKKSKKLNKMDGQIKQKQTHRYGEQISVTRGIRELRGGQKG